MSDDEWDFESDEEGKPDEKFSYLPPQLLIGIDAHSSMFVKTEGGLHAFHSCLLGICAVLDHILLRSDKKSVAVILADDFDKKALLTGFDVPVSDKLVIVKKLLDMNDEDIKADYMRTGTFDFASFLLLAKRQFEKTTTETRTRTFLYITNDSNPVGDDAKMKFRALHEAQNFSALKIRFEVVTMSPSFTWNEFYEEMYKAMDTPLVKELCEDDDGIADRILLVVKPAMRLRSVCFFPAVGNTEIFMRVHIDSVVHRSKVVLNKQVTLDTHAEVRKTPHQVVREKKQKKRKRVKPTLKAEDIEPLKSSQYPIGYALLGVVDGPMSRPEVYIKKHNLMYENPKEECNYLNMFWKYCVEKKKELFCSYRHSNKCQPSFCEMIPKIVNNKCCFLIKHLHFLDDYNEIDPAEPPFDDDAYDEEEEEESVREQVTDSVINDVKKLVDALTFPYDPQAFYDVDGVKEEAYVKAQVLDQPVEDVEDITDVSKCKMNKMLDDLGVVQKRMIEVKDEKLSQQSQSGKKARGGATRKNVKKEK